MSYKFIYESDGKKVVVDTNEVVLDDILEDFKNFLVASGFNYISSDELVCVGEEEVIISENELQKLQEEKE